jgi:hypothetical protein
MHLYWEKEPNMNLQRIIIGLSLSTILAAGAQATPVSTIWVDNASFGAPILQEYDLTTSALITQITAPLGNNGRGVVTVGNIVYYTSANTNGVYAYNYVTNTNLGTAFTVAGASGLSTMAYDGTNFWIGDYSGTNHAYLYSPTGTPIAEMDSTVRQTSMTSTTSMAIFCIPRLSPATIRTEIRESPLMVHYSTWIMSTVALSTNSTSMVTISKPFT